MDQKNYYVIGGAVVALIAIIIAYQVGFSAGVKSGDQTAAERLQTQIDKQQQVLDAFFPAPPENVVSITGEVKEVGADFINVEYSIAPRYPIPGEPATKKTVKVMVNEQTSINSIIAGTTKTVSIKDVKVGAAVTVSAAENIKDKEEFIASTINLQTAGAAGGPAGIPGMGGVPPPPPPTPPPPPPPPAPAPTK